MVSPRSDEEYDLFWVIRGEDGSDNRYVWEMTKRDDVLVVDGRTGGCMLLTILLHGESWS